jgi:hypothetical protein
MSLRNGLYQQESEFIAQSLLVRHGSHLRTYKRISLAPHAFHVGKRHALLAEAYIMRRENALEMLIYKPHCR